MGIHRGWPRARSRGAGFLSLLLALVVIVVVTLIALKLFERSNPLPAAPGEHPARAVVERVSLRVEGLSTELDALQVTEALRRVPGVMSAAVEASTGEARVAFDPRRTDPDRLLAAIQQAGFRARR
ncbi:MAG: heavy-metal-associated domain-containing protein [Terriglobia bacterium]